MNIVIEFATPTIIISMHGLESTAHKHYVLETFIVARLAKDSS